LREQGEVDRAVSFARNFITSQPDWWMPVLFSRLRDNRIFESSSPNVSTSLSRQPFEPETIFIPFGVFLMGTDDPAQPLYEHPQHPINLKSYRIGKFPVTNREYAEFIHQAKRNVPPEVWGGAQTLPKGQEKMPVQGVTWYDAFDYCKWLSKKTGRTYRLPTEAEWEKAARGDDGRIYPWGNTWDPARCSSDANSPKSADALPPQSVYGCFDMVGNVREWTLSLWGQNRPEPESAYLYPYVDADGRNDPTASKLVRRIIRGAGLNDFPESITCFARNAYIPDKPGPPGKRHGFRVVMDI
jgi:formylglycine-generating enzyme required for sulfatase activity